MSTAAAAWLSMPTVPRGAGNLRSPGIGCASFPMFHPDTAWVPGCTIVSTPIVTRPTACRQLLKEQHGNSLGEQRGASSEEVLRLLRERCHLYVLRGPLAAANSSWCATRENTDPATMLYWYVGFSPSLLGLKKHNYRHNYKVGPYSSYKWPPKTD